MRHPKLQQIAYTMFIGSVSYVGGTSPCGRFHYEAVEGFFGNIFLKLSHQYIFLYMGFIIHVIDILEKGLLSIPYSKLYCEISEYALSFKQDSTTKIDSPV